MTKSSEMRTGQPREKSTEGVREKKGKMRIGEKQRQKHKTAEKESNGKKSGEDSKDTC
jgi:hypothetical protein